MTAAVGGAVSHAVAPRSPAVKPPGLRGSRRAPQPRELETTSPSVSTGTSRTTVPTIHGEETVFERGDVNQTGKRPRGAAVKIKVAAAREVVADLRYLIPRNKTMARHLDQMDHDAKMALGNPEIEAFGSAVKMAVLLTAGIGVTCMGLKAVSNGCKALFNMAGDRRSGSENSGSESPGSGSPGSGSPGSGSPGSGGPGSGGPGSGV